MKPLTGAPRSIRSKRLHPKWTIWALKVTAAPARARAARMSCQGVEKRAVTLVSMLRAASGPARPLMTSGPRRACSTEDL
jgi:uracil phosphoribosyltransferase